jgi:competence protein ComEC
MLVKVLAIFLVFLLFVFRYYFALYSLPDFTDLYGEVSVEACIVEDIDLRESHAKYVVEVEELGRILIKANKYPEYSRGDCVLWEGLVVPVPYIENFDYSSYLRRYHLTAIFEVDRSTLIRSGGLGVLKIFDLLRARFEELLKDLFVDPYGDFMAGLLLGRKRGLSQELMNKFNALGLTHIVAVSGYNVTLIVVSVFTLGGFLKIKRKVKVVLAVLLLSAFVVLVGASAAVVRAGVMGVISLMAVYFGRIYNVSRALIMVLILSYFYNPFIVIDDVGFQLSFLSTCGIVYLYPFLERWGRWIPNVFVIRESLLMTIAAQIAVAPILYFSFGQFALISPFVNVVVLPLIPFAMLAGFLAVVFSLFGIPLSSLLAFFAYLLMKVVLLIVEVFYYIIA